MLVNAADAICDRARFSYRGLDLWEAFTIVSDPELCDVGSGGAIHPRSI